MLRYTVKNCWKRGLVGCLAWMILLCAVTMPVLAAVAEGLEPQGTAEEETVTAWTGKTLSILGDSISTFSGVSNNTTYNSTIGSNSVYYSGGTLGVQQADTWWQQVIDVLGMKLLVNNSWSGSCILKPRRGAGSEGYGDRCVNLHNDVTGEEPDVIAVFLGTNDFSYYQSTLGTADAIDYDTLITENGDGTYTYATPVTSCEAYAIMLHKMTQRYPEAEIYCMTLLPRRDPDYADSYADVGQPTAFNAELEKIITRFGAVAVDLEECGITSESANFDVYMGDKRVHPNARGMDKMSQAVIDALMGVENASFVVSQKLTNVLTDASAGIVLAGDTYSATLTAAAGFDDMTVTVTMGGEDITSSCYADGKVTIPSVTGDVVITATGNIDDTPDHYRWELGESGLVCIEGDNALTPKAGSVTEGVINNAYYSLEVPVILRHDQPWVVEWKASGSGWSGMIFSANANAGTAGNSYLFKTTSTSGFIGFGERVNSTYENYGIALSNISIDTAIQHVYRVENRIDADGSNMAYLIVDGVDYGAMNHFFIGGSNDQGQTVDWLNGRDFCFSYIGASSHPINNCTLEYLQVWETHGTHTAVTDVAAAPTCTETGLTQGSHCAVCGEVLTAQQVVDALGHDMGAWSETLAPGCESKREERRDCSRCDHFETREVAATGHDYDAVVTPPTCTERGYTTHTCTKCGDSYVDSCVDALGHDMGAWSETLAPGCESKGEERRDCSRCDHFETREVAATGHDYDAVATPPTCTERGYTTHTCTKCGDSYVDGYVDALGHDMGAWSETLTPGCESKGEERRDCSRCDHFETREVEATGHDYDAVVTPPTCTERGYTTHTCTECGDSYVDGYVDALGHQFTRYVSDGNATMEADGTKTAGCDHAGCEKTHTLPDEGSKLFPEKITSEVHTVNGEVVSKISVETTVGGLLAGILQGEHCKVYDDVGEVQSDRYVGTGMTVKLEDDDTVKDSLVVIVTGDVNGDGTITVSDVIAIKAHILQKVTHQGAEALAADVNGDKKITVTDFVQLKAHILRKSQVHPW